MFAWRVDRIHAELVAHLPEIAAGLARLQAAWGTPAWQRALNSAYAGFPSQSIDYSVMEKSTDVWVAEVDIGWSRNFQVARKDVEDAAHVSGALDI